MMLSLVLLLSSDAMAQAEDLVKSLKDAAYLGAAGIAVALVLGTGIFVVISQRNKANEKKAATLQRSSSRRRTAQAAMLDAVIVRKVDIAAVTRFVTGFSVMSFLQHARRLFVEVQCARPHGRLDQAIQQQLLASARESAFRGAVGLEAIDNIRFASTRLVRTQARPDGCLIVVAFEVFVDERRRGEERVAKYKEQWSFARVVDGDWRVLDIVREHDFEVPQLDDESLTLARDPELKQQLAEFEKANPEISWEDVHKGVGTVFQRIHLGMASHSADEVAQLLAPSALDEMRTQLQCGRPAASGEPVIEEVVVLRLVADALDEFMTVGIRGFWRGRAPDAIGPPEFADCWTFLRSSGGAWLLLWIDTDDSLLR